MKHFHPLAWLIGGVVALAFLVVRLWVSEGDVGAHIFGAGAVVVVAAIGGFWSHRARQK